VHIVSRNSGLDGASRDTGDVSVRNEPPKMVKNRLERALVAEIGGIEVPEEGNPFARFFALFHACHPLWRPCENILRDHVHDANLQLDIKLSLYKIKCKY
jgi:hypothetical protein